jgi:hypothetical protein
MSVPGLLSGLPLAAETQVGSTSWLVVGWVFVGIGVLSALTILADILRGYRQHMAIMNWVWPITGLYWGPVAVSFYFHRGRQVSHRWAAEHRVDLELLMSSDGEDPPGYWAFARKNWWPISRGVSHCGAGCTIGDIVGEWIVYLTGWTIAIFASPAANSLPREREVRGVHRHLTATATGTATTVSQVIRTGSLRTPIAASLPSRSG